MITHPKTHPIIRRTYRFRLKPTKKQVRFLEHYLRVCCEAYNAGLQERREAWTLCRKSVTYAQQSAQIKEIRKIRPDVEEVPFVLVRESLRRLDRAFAGFFQRWKRRERPGFPRFKSSDRFNSLTLYSSDAGLCGDAVTVPKLGCVRFKAHRAIEGIPKQFTLKKLGTKWQISVVCELGPAPLKLPVRSSVGIDVGLRTFATLSDGTEIPNPRWIDRSEEQIARCNRSLSRKKRASKNRAKSKERLRRAHERVANRRLNFCHHASKQLVSAYDLIAFEKLTIRNMVRGNQSKSIMDAGWGILLWQIAYKAASAGCHAVAVDPRDTSQKCSACGEIVKKPLSQRVHFCPHCRLVLGRDRNASHNILALGRSAVGLPPQEFATQF
jgi:putative transposase